MGIDFRRPRHIRGFRLGEVMVFGPGIGKTLVEKTVSGAVANFSDGADDVPIRAVTCTVNPNLSGVSSINLMQTKKNLIKPDKYQTASNNLALGQNDGTSFGTFLKAGTYTISYTTSGETCYIYRRESNDSSNTNMGKKLSATFTLASEGHFRFWLYSDGAVSSNISNVQIEVGSTATAYEAFTAPTVTNVPLGRTIYGGTADVVTGVGTDGYAKDSMTSTYLSGLSSDYIGYESSTAYFGGHPSIWVRNWNYQRAKARQSGGIGCACNYFPVSMHNTTIFSSQYRIYFDVNGKNISSVADFIAFVTALEQNNESLDIVFELATSTDFTFDPITPTPHTALGTNNLWNDCGDSEVTYYADPDLSSTQLQSFALMATEEQNSSTQEDNT